MIQLEPQPPIPLPTPEEFRERMERAQEGMRKFEEQLLEIRRQQRSLMMLARYNCEDRERLYEEWRAKWKEMELPRRKWTAAVYSFLQAADFLNLRVPSIGRLQRELDQRLALKR